MLILQLKYYYIIRYNICHKITQEKREFYLKYNVKINMGGQVYFIMKHFEVGAIPNNNKYKKIYQQINMYNKI